MRKPKSLRVGKSIKLKTMKNLMIKETLWVNILRSFCAGIVWAIISCFMPGDGSPFYIKLMFPLVMPFILGMFYIVSLMLKLFKLDGVGNIICMLASVPGDPLVYILNNLKPEWVPVKEYKFLWFVGIILVYDKDINIKQEKIQSNNTNNCPFVGKVIADKDVQIFYIDWTKKETIFTITNEWRVLTKYDSKFGWIDIDGRIHKGIIFDVDPKAIMSGELTELEIQQNYLYNRKEKIGELISELY